jgi:ABC-type amino acid transport system permease subunit
MTANFARLVGAASTWIVLAAAAVALVAGTAASLRAGEAGWRALRGVWLGALAILISSVCWRSISASKRSRRPMGRADRSPWSSPSWGSSRRAALHRAGAWTPVEAAVIRTFCIAFIEFVRGVPLITVLFMSSVMLPLSCRRH